MPISHIDSAQQDGSLGDPKSEEVLSISISQEEDALSFVQEESLDICVKTKAKL